MKPDWYAEAKQKKDAPDPSIEHKSSSTCKKGKPHDWQLFKQDVYPDYALARPDGYQGPTRQRFIIKGCPNCKKKIYMSMESS